MKKALSFLFVIGLAASSVLSAQENTKLRMAVEGAHRPAADKARDIYRNPYETLTFFGIESHFTVIESWPGGGWYTQILAPYLKDKGKLIAATYDRGETPPAAYMKSTNAAYDAFLVSNPAVYGSVAVTAQLSSEASTLAEPGTVDAIVDFRNAHNWLGAGADNIVSAWHAALKTGGIVGLVDHRMDADKPSVPGSGYLHEKQVIDLMESHGFTLAGRSEINANPSDTKDYAGGVWTLPPNLRRVDDAQRAMYEAIGESDRMTLKFVKN